jgi:hypothetical protein
MRSGYPFAHLNLSRFRLSSSPDYTFSRTDSLMRVFIAVQFLQPRAYIVKDDDVQ